MRKFLLSVLIFGTLALPVYAQDKPAADTKTASADSVKALAEIAKQDSELDVNYFEGKLAEEHKQALTALHQLLSLQYEIVRLRALMQAGITDPDAKIDDKGNISLPAVDKQP